MMKYRYQDEPNKDRKLRQETKYRNINPKTTI